MKAQREVLSVDLVHRNLTGLAAFVEQLLTFDGKVNTQYLHRVNENGSGIEVVQGSENDWNNDYAILIGGEVPNSFCTLYEAAYFFEALLLSAVGTAYLAKFGPHDQSRRQENFSRRRIKSHLLEITNDELLSALQRPSINIVSSLDTDIEPYRYVKHQLWRMRESAFKKRCSDVTSDDFGKQSLDESLRGIYWIERDRQIAEEAMSYADTLPHAKAIQYYLTLKEVLSELGMDLSNIPWYFNFAPREEILLLGPNNEFLKAVITLHETNFRKVLSRITRADHPWIISLSCPKCHESSKKIIRATLRADCKTIHLVCSQYPQEYRNELGTKIVRRGCGYSWNFEVPTDSEQLYELFKDKSPTLNFAIRSLLAVIKTTADCPISWPLTELGIVRDRNAYVTGPDLPKGFGDHRDLITSVVTMQHLLTRGMIIPEFSQGLIQKQLLTSREMQILSWACKTKLSDLGVSCQDNKKVHVTDTSVLKVMEKGIPPRELFRRSIDINEVRLEQFLTLQRRSLRELLDGDVEKTYGEQPINT